MITILLVDDQNLVQQGIKSLLDQDIEVKVIGTVTDGRTAIQQIERLRPDIVLLDIEMPGMDGITTTKYINRLSPKTKVIILSSHEDTKFVTQALVAGAKGYLLKSSLMTDLKHAILAVHNGYSQVESRLLAKVFDPKNIKPKKRKPTSQIKKVNEQNNNEIKLKNKELTNGQNFSKISPSPHPKFLEQTSPETAETDAETDSARLDRKILPTQELNPVLSAKKTPEVEPSKPVISDQETPEVEPSEPVTQEAQELDSTLLKQDDLPADESLLLEQRNIEDDIQNYEVVRYEKRSLSFPNPTDLTLLHNESLKQYKSLKSNRSRRKRNNLVVKTSMVLNTLLNQVQQLSNKQKLYQYKTQILKAYKSILSQYKPKIRQYKSRLSQYKNSLLLLVARSRQTSWLSYIGLMMLGGIIVLILHNL